MTITHPASIATRLRKTAGAALFTTAMAIATTALGQSAIANAEPNSGQDAFDACRQSWFGVFGHNPPTQKDYEDSELDCCVQTSGKYVGTYPGGVCIFPPAGSAGSTLPGEQLNPNLPQPTRETVQPGPTAQPGPVPPVQPVG
jgi:hypothetical protein